jgi:signal transduction histidine kinase
MGKITANMTHEIRNVLAIIKESAGLMEDVMLLGKGDPLQQADRIKRMISKILDQVDRGTLLATELSRFAHSADTQHAAIEINEMLEHLVVVTRRFARNRLVDLETRRSNTTCTLLGDPMKVEMAVFAAVEAALTLAPSVKTISLQAKADQDAVGIDVCLGGMGAEAGEWCSGLQAGDGWKTLVETCRDAGARVEMAGGARSFRLVFGDAPRGA